MIAWDRFFGGWRPMTVRIDVAEDPGRNVRVRSSRAMDRPAQHLDDVVDFGSLSRNNGDADALSCSPSSASPSRPSPMPARPRERRSATAPEGRQDQARRDWCHSASNFDPFSAANIDPTRSSELGTNTATYRARGAVSVGRRLGVNRPADSHPERADPLVSINDNSGAGGKTEKTRNKIVTMDAVPSHDAAQDEDSATNVSWTTLRANGSRTPKVDSLAGGQEGTRSKSIVSRRSSPMCRALRLGSRHKRRRDPMAEAPTPLVVRRRSGRQDQGRRRAPTRRPRPSQENASCCSPSRYSLKPRSV